MDVSLKKFFYSVLLTKKLVAWDSFLLLLLLLTDNQVLEDVIYVRY